MLVVSNNLPLVIQLITTTTLSNRRLGIPDAFVELQNVSSKTIELVYVSHPLESLRIEIRNESGMVISIGRYGSKYARIRSCVSILELKQNETYRHPVQLFGSVPSDQRIPGKYSGQLFYMFKNNEIPSDQFIFVIEASREKQTTHDTFLGNKDVSTPPLGLWLGADLGKPKRLCSQKCVACCRRDRIFRWVLIKSNLVLIYFLLVSSHDDAPNSRYSIRDNALRRDCLRT